MSDSHPRVWALVALLVTLLAIGLWHRHLVGESARTAPTVPRGPPSDTPLPMPASRIIDPDHAEDSRKMVITRHPTSPPAVSTRLDVRERLRLITPAISPCDGALGRWHVREGVEIVLQAHGEGRRTGQGLAAPPFHWTCSGNGDIRLELSDAEYSGRHDPSSDVLVLVGREGHALRATRASAP